MKKKKRVYEAGWFKWVGREKNAQTTKVCPVL